MCCCDSDIIAILCVGLPMIAYAVFFGFIPRDIKKLGEALSKCTGGGSSSSSSSSSSNNKGIINCLVEDDDGKVFIIISAIALICIIYGIVVQVLKCVLACCTCCCPCCGCLDCFLKYAFRIGVGVGYPSLVDFFTYLITAVRAKGSNSTITFNSAFGSYSGLSMVSLGAGWVFTVLISSFFIHKDSCGLKFLGLILGCIVAFVVIAAIVGCDPYGYANGYKWAGVLLGIIDVLVFTAMYSAALCCLNGCCK